MRIILNLGQTDHICRLNLQEYKCCLSCGRYYTGHHRSLYCLACSGVKGIISSQRLRAANLGLVNHFTIVQWLVLLHLTNNRCVSCGQQKQLLPDHIVSLILNGQNTIDNIQPVCMPCNGVKGCKIIDYRRGEVKDFFDKWLNNEIKVEFTKD